MDDESSAWVTLTRGPPHPLIGAVHGDAGLTSSELAEIRCGRLHQSIIDAEVRASRRAILAMFRLRLRTDATTLHGPDFLAVADRQTVHAAVIIAARSITRADACDLQIHDPGSRSLRSVRQHGLPRPFLEDDESAPGQLETGVPMLIDDITRSPALADRPALGMMLAAGFHAVQFYPLHAPGGRLLAVLSLYYRAAGRHPAQKSLARCAARALAYLDETPAVTLTSRR